MLVAGVDSSQHSTKVILCEAGDGTIVARASAPHPGGTECPPQAWQDALTKAGDGLLSRAAAVGVAGQQHGMVVLDSGAEVIRPALLWNDLRSAAAAAELVAERGPGWWAERTGSVPNASFTVTKLRWLAEHEPDHAARVFRVMLPHDWLTWALLAGPPAGQEPVTDRGDASGTGYFSPADGAWLPEVAADALGHQVRLPRVARPAEAVGETGWGAVVSAGTGDNMGAALGLGLAPGEVAVSVGTSGTACAVTTVAAADPSGAIAGFADATGRFLPLVCTINAALVLDSVAALLGTDAAGLSARAMAAGPGAGGITLLPYFDGERTPVRPGATGALHGRTGCFSSAAGPAPRRSARRPRASSAARWTCRSRRSTWRSARPARRRGRWPAPRTRPPGRAGPPSATRAPTSPASGSASPRSGTPPPAWTAGSPHASTPDHNRVRAQASRGPSFIRKERLAVTADAYPQAPAGRHRSERNM